MEPLEDNCPLVLILIVSVQQLLKSEARLSF